MAYTFTCFCENGTFQDIIVRVSPPRDFCFEQFKTYSDIVKIYPHGAVWLIFYKNVLGME